MVMINGIYSFRGISLPENLKESIDAYVGTGRPVGDFLSAVLDNNLRRAFAHGDEISIASLPAIVGYLHNECPALCWGFAGAFDAWIERKRKERELAATS